MIKLDDNLLQELGLGLLPPEDKKKMLAHIYETLEMRVGMELAKQMTDAQLSEFEEFINRNDEAGALRWLETNFPNYKEVVAAEFEKLKLEIKQVAPQILANAQQQAQVPQQTQGQPYPSAPQSMPGNFATANQPQPAMPPTSYPAPQQPYAQSMYPQPAYPGTIPPPSPAMTAPAPVTYPSPQVPQPQQGQPSMYAQGPQQMGQPQAQPFPYPQQGFAGPSPAAQPQQQQQAQSQPGPYAQQPPANDGNDNTLANAA